MAVTESTVKIAASITPKRAVRKLKRTIFAHAPFLRSAVLWTVRCARRLFRIPHQPHYAALNLIHDDGLYLDIGANHGQSIESIRLYKSNRIISFEANPVVGEKLKARYSDTQVVGLGKSDGTFKLYVPGYRGALFEPCASLRRDLAQAILDNGPVYFYRPRHARIEEVTCRVRTLDSFQLSPALMKIDVEGAELDVIEGAMQTIRRCLPIILIENMPAAVMKMLAALGYRRYWYKRGALVEGHQGVGDSFLIPDCKRALIY